MEYGSGFFYNVIIRPVAFLGVGVSLALLAVKSLSMKQKRKESSRSQWPQSEQQIRGLLAEYGRQGQSVKIFCQAKGLPEWRFYSWKKRYAISERRDDPHPGFVALQVRKMDAPVAVRSAELFAEVQSAQGTCIRIFQPVAPSYLQALLS